jgi:hypothetical protein
MTSTYLSAALTVYSTATASRKEKLKQNISVLEMHYLLQKCLFDNIFALVELREEMEERISSILSDYTQMVNQVALVSTLTLGMALGAFGSLLGNTDGQPEWKKHIFVVSSVVSSLCAIVAVLESFFLSIHINQIEARFAAGIYPHLCKECDDGTPRRQFETSELSNFNADFNFIVFVFFGSFFSFAVTLLSSVYLGLGLSDSIFLPDDGPLPPAYTEIYPNFTKISQVEIHYTEYSKYTTIAVFAVYGLLLIRFFSKYLNYIHSRRLLKLVVYFCGCERYTSNLKTPMIHVATKFNELQKQISEEAKEWYKSNQKFIELLKTWQKDDLNFINNEKELIKIEKTDKNILVKLFNFLENVYEFTIKTVEDKQEQGNTAENAMIRITKRNAFKRYETAVMQQQKLLRSLINTEIGGSEYRIQNNANCCGRLLQVLWTLSFGLILFVIEIGFIIITLVIVLVWKVSCGCCGRCKNDFSLKDTWKQVKNDFQNDVSNSIISCCLLNVPKCNRYYIKRISEWCPNKAVSVNKAVMEENGGISMQDNIMYINSTMRNNGRPKYNGRPKQKYYYTKIEF